MNDQAPDSEGTLLLLETAASGDNAAFEKLFDRHRAHLRQYIELRMDWRLRQRLDVSDVLQETQWEVYRRLRDYSQRRPMPLRVWLRKTALERLLNLREKHIAANRRTSTRELPLPEASSLALAKQLIAKGASPSEQLVERERKEAVVQAISQLPNADREILLMRNIEGLDYTEIGYSLEITPAAARKRFGRALLRLEQCLRANGWSDASS